MSYIEAIILGFVQGITEFLPVSSSGHLALLQNIFGIDQSNIVLFTVLLHVGTLISVFIMYWKDIWELIKELCLTVKDLITGKGLRLDERPVRRLGVFIIIATIITAIIGFTLNDLFESMYSSIFFIGLGFLATGTMLFLSERNVREGKDIMKMRFSDALFIGFMQGLAIYPGISRSGSTIVGGLSRNLDRELAVKFAFLISIPTIIGSALLEGKEALETGIDTSVIGPVLVGMIVAAISGIIAIKTMIKVASNRKLKYFSYYVWLLGTGVVMYSIYFSM